MKLVLTGSIGMGKSTVAKMFAEHGVSIWSADEAVKKRYADDQELLAFITSTAPHAIENGQLNFNIWRSVLRASPDLLDALEAIIHPKIAEDRAHFVATHDRSLCEIPLYFENGEKGNFDAVIVVSANAEVQRERVLARGTMTSEDFDFILSRQVPDEQKREKADFVIRTDCPLEETREQVQNVLNTLGIDDA